MFGYVLPRKDRLSEADAARYRAAYCGLCRCLRLHYGFRARFLVNYDMTFLYFLACGEETGAPLRCRCPASPFCRKTCLPDSPALRYAADLSVLLSYWKLRDAERDGRFPRRLAARSALLLYRRAYRRAAARLPECDAVFAEKLRALHELEDARCPSLDRAADGFASLLRICAGFAGDDTQRRALELLLYHVGRFLYLVDALEDLPADNRRGAYNPLRYRYRLENGALGAADKAQFLDTVEASVGMAASALELLPQADAIARNIIYYGLPAVLHSVADGTFRKRGKHK